MVARQKEFDVVCSLDVTALASEMLTGVLEPFCTLHCIIINQKILNNRDQNYLYKTKKKHLFFFSSSACEHIHRSL